MGDDTHKNKQFVGDEVEGDQEKGMRVCLHLLTFFSLSLILSMGLLLSVYSSFLHQSCIKILGEMMEDDVQKVKQSSRDKDEGDKQYPYRRYKELEDIVNSQSSFDYKTVTFETDLDPKFDFDEHISFCLHANFCQCECKCCKICDLKHDYETKASFWKDKIKEIVSDEWDNDSRHHPDLLSVVENCNTEDIVMIGRRCKVFEYVDLFINAITDDWYNGYPLNAKLNLANLSSLVATEMNILNQKYNWPEVIEFLSKEIDLEIVRLHLLNIHIM